MSEHQNIEYKQSWRDEYLKWICGFANAQGGKIYIGVNDNGIVTGIDDPKKLMDDIPNKAVNHLGLVIDVNLLKDKGKEYIEIVVPVSPMPISYHGAYHFRSGSTKQELKGAALHEFLLKKIGRTWDDIGISNAKIEDLDIKSIASFVKAAVKSGRIYKEAEKDDIPTLLENLQLITPDGELKAAAILLFGKNPKKFFVTSYFKIGKFGDSDSELKFQDTVEGNIFDMVEAVITLLKQRYIISTISYEGIQRIEKPEYPDAAIREAILNAIVHKDYTDSTIQMSIYDDKIILWNPGKLSEDLTIEKLKSKHPSRARNKNIAEVFFKAGYIESWGRGIEKMIDALKGDGLPEPIFEENSGGFQVTFLKESYSKEYLNQIGLNERQIKAVEYLRDAQELTNAKYQEINNIGKSISAVELQELIDKGVVNKIGKGKLTKYSLK
ncbi:ATP-binding protein [Pedobacter cryoconitis]|uniref:ATP-binding protein n=1 Tax=Pedobacter cryoconitis TaxID=188932 RepID=UPI0016178AAA|nr:ATP-binding protein [Pedobacter cryoconitis]MBB5647663.1 ATP-dependent DNA helicase RecG [Pedobacter cryoconitis]